MVRIVMFVRDLVIALALGWIGVSIEPAAREEACTLKGADAAMCASASRHPSFSVSTVAGEAGCPGG